MKLLVCGAASINVADWQASAEYEGVDWAGAGSQEAAWFWEVVKGMDDDDRARLLHFCTGSSRAPASGFNDLQGYMRAQRFTLVLIAGGEDRFPTAATCFNQLRMPQYSSLEQTRARILGAITMQRGFDEAAAAFVA
jgi:hypothetical protein